MAKITVTRTRVLIAVGAVAVWTAAAGARQTVPTATHPAVGSWFGQAIQVCPAGVAPSACANGQPAATLFMTPTLTSDGLFVADDSFTLLGAPFGPHMTAHGSWIATSRAEFSAEYVFVTKTFPPVPEAFSGLRARWSGRALDANTLVGWVNAYFLPNTPLKWAKLLEDEYPVLPPEAAAFYTPPSGFVKDPTLCKTAGCPQVFKFTLKRITR